ncbi:Sporulation domain protein [Hymenobacter roseosalivarius DSM 11622]|uniref:Sporulation domain protein n=1 Tax=Hymenobacter roseosalivarius DSM 11622 TaxID=645990 RepID=A0A1W1W2K3_9BACT|nr:SPOR domain-containing protein [Hymenobacter roseosalivarius]SMB99852.1 Sporulation domain protein [Hymenobacter roseosalivarius DSM 11622]
MPISDHILSLLRDHDCVIIPGFGGLIADYAPARIHPVRHTLTPPTKTVAFNGALTRNDGLLVDALSHTLGVPASEARQMVRHAVGHLQAELDSAQRTELPGIGIFRRAFGRGLEFEYTGTQNLLAASYGLPELVSRPVRATDALLARERQPTGPQLTVAGRSRRSARVFNVAAATILTGLMLSAGYLFALRLGHLPDSVRAVPASWVAQEQKMPPSAVKPNANARQQATLANHGWSEEFVPDGAPDAKAPVTVPTAEIADWDAAKPVDAASTALTNVNQLGEPAAKPMAAAKAVAVPKAIVAPAPAKPATVAKVTPAATPATATSATTIKNRTGRFYVVAGSFDTPRSVEKARAALARKNRPAQILWPVRPTRASAGSRFYRLTVGEFTDRASADRSLSQLRKQYGSALWVLKY